MNVCIVRLPVRKQWLWEGASMFAGLVKCEQVRLMAVRLTAVP